MCTIHLINPMRHVLIRQAAEYESYDQQVLGVFDSIEAMNVQKEMLDPDDHEYWYYQTMETNVAYLSRNHDITLSSASTLLKMQRTRELQEEKELAAARVKEAIAQKHAVHVQEMTGRINEFINKYVDIDVVVDINHFPFIVVEYIDSLLDEISHLYSLRDSSDPFKDQKLYKTDKRIGWYMSQYVDIRKLIADSTEECIVFESIMDMANGCLDKWNDDKASIASTASTASTTSAVPTKIRQTSNVRAFI